MISRRSYWSEGGDHVTTIHACPAATDQVIRTTPPTDFCVFESNGMRYRPDTWVKDLAIVWGPVNKTKTLALRTKEPCVVWYLYQWSLVSLIQSWFRR